MADTQIHGTEQVQAGTITDASVSSSAAIAQDKLARASAILLSDGSIVMAAALNLGTNQVNNLADGVASTDGVNLGQVEALIAAGVNVFTDTGAWSSGTAYVVNDVVQIGGSTYNCIAANTGMSPVSSPTYWNLWASSGATGTRGSEIFLGSGVPGTISGQANGDCYVDVANGNFYQLAAGTWSLEFNLSGGGLGSVVSVASTSTFPGMTDAVANSTATPTIALTPTGGLTSNQFIATPDGAAGAVALRNIVNDDLPDSGATAGSYGSGSEVATGTVNAQGIWTAIATTSISIASSAVTDFATAVGSLISAASVAASQLTGVIASANLPKASSSAFGVVEVDGTTISASGGVISAIVGSGASFSVGETPSGAMNGSNETFSLANAPSTGSLAVYYNGVRQQNSFFTLSGADFTLTFAPSVGDTLIVDYRY